MTFALILVLLGNGTQAKPTLVTPPQIVGQFTSMQECTAAARSAEFVAFGIVTGGGHTGAQFLCVESK
jgi:hypothetical protein